MFDGDAVAELTASFTRAEKTSEKVVKRDGVKSDNCWSIECTWASDAAAM
jgi:hypothetical protein